MNLSLYLTIEWLSEDVSTTDPLQVFHNKNLLYLLIHIVKNSLHY